MDDFQKSVTNKPCPYCGSEGFIETNGVGYSCPAVYYFECKHCGTDFDAQDPEDGIKVLSLEESIKKRPGLYLDKVEYDWYNSSDLMTDEAKKAIAFIRAEPENYANNSNKTVRALARQTLERQGKTICKYCAKDISGYEGNDNYRIVMGVEDRTPEYENGLDLDNRFCGLVCIKLYLNECDIDTQYDPRNDPPVRKKNES